MLLDIGGVEPVESTEAAAPALSAPGGAWLRVLLSLVVVVGVLVGAAASSAATINDFPCAGCVLSVPPNYNPARPVTLFVALHGDEGNPSYISSVWDPAGDQLGAIVLSPECPQALGCPGSWWGWLESGTYNDAWLGQQVDQVEAHYNIDRNREYLTGWSGGADFLGSYALAHADRFAAAAFVVGGVPYHQQCPAKPLPAYFLMGANDFRHASGQPSQVQGILNACGDQTQLTVLPGEDHSGTIAALTNQRYAMTIFTWLEQHSRGQATSNTASSPPPTGMTGPTQRPPHRASHKRRHKHRTKRHRAKRHHRGTRTARAGKRHR